MRRDVPQLADHWWWRPGWQVGTRYYSWHATLDDQPELRDVVARYQQALAPFDVLDVVPEQWLHITMQGVGHVAEVTDSDRDAVVDAVRGELAAVAAEPTTFTRPVVHPEGVAVDAVDAGPLQRVRHAVRAGMARALDPRPVPGDHDGYTPHLSLAYVNAAADPTGIQEALDAVAVAPVTVTLRHVSLIEMHRDDRMYEWRTVEQVRIGAQ